MKRRDALKAMGGIAGASALGHLLPGCGSSPGSNPDAHTSPDAYPNNIPGITTVVVMMMENRSYNHLLGARTLLEGKPGDGLTATMANNDLTGTSIPIFQVGDHDSVCIVDPPHDWDSCHNAFNLGANDGFVQAYETAYSNNPALTGVMGYLARVHEPVTWALADSYTTCDRWFCSVMGPTWPNRMYWHSGTSNGIKDNKLPTSGFTWPTIYHRLEAKNVDWAYYYGDVPVLSVLTSLPDVNDHIFRFEDFLKHAMEGKLPPVVYIDPSFSANDDHPPKHTMLGQQLIASVYTALANSPQWKNILFVLTYDEHGGYFDHVAPPTSADDNTADGFDQLGFRVPGLVMGPFAKGGVVSTQYDHTSVLKYLENKFGLDPLTARSTAANPIDDCIDQTRLAADDWQPPAAIPAVTVNQSDITANCTTSMLRGSDHPILQFADQRPDLFGWGDLRDRQEEVLTNIAEFLAAHNAGGINKDE